MIIIIVILIISLFLLYKYIQPFTNVLETNPLKLWSDKLNEWKKYPLTYPKNIKKRFFYQTSYCNKELNSPFTEKFIESDLLEELTQNYSDFIEYIKNPKTIDITSFYNKANDTLLIIPLPEDNKDFTTIKDFIDNASINKQKQFWNYVNKEIINFLKTNDKVYISTHGLGVPYFHLRLCNYPKYY